MKDEPRVPVRIWVANRRRDILFAKGQTVGLTPDEFREYCRLRQKVFRFIKRTWPENWENVKWLVRHNREPIKRTTAPAGQQGGTPR